VQVLAPLYHYTGLNALRGDHRNRVGVVHRLPPYER
jgi:hypothetical protein